MSKPYLFLSRFLAAALIFGMPISSTYSAPPELEQAQTTVSLSGGVVHPTGESWVAAKIKSAGFTLSDTQGLKICYERARKDQQTISREKIESLKIKLQKLKKDREVALYSLLDPDLAADAEKELQAKKNSYSTEIDNIQAKLPSMEEATHIDLNESYESVKKYFAARSGFIHCDFSDDVVPPALMPFTVHIRVPVTSLKGVGIQEVEFAMFRIFQSSPGWSRDVFLLRNYMSERESVNVLQFNIASFHFDRAVVMKAGGFLDIAIHATLGAGYGIMERSKMDAHEIKTNAAIGLTATDSTVMSVWHRSFYGRGGLSANTEARVELRFSKRLALDLKQGLDAIGLGLWGASADPLPVSDVSGSADYQQIQNAVPFLIAKTSAQLQYRLNSEGASIPMYIQLGLTRENIFESWDIQKGSDTDSRTPLHIDEISHRGEVTFQVGW